MSRQQSDISRFAVIFATKQRKIIVKIVTNKNNKIEVKSRNYLLLSLISIFHKHFVFIGILLSFAQIETGGRLILCKKF